MRTDLSRVCRLSRASRDLYWKPSFSMASHMSRFNTSFLTLTFVVRFDVFSQWRLASDANSPSCSPWGTSLLAAVLAGATC